MKNWTTRDMASQQGRLAVITGATGGLGYETALALAGAGARVVLTGRNPVKGAAALAHIRAVHPGADIHYDALDLASLASVQHFVERFMREHDALDILVNNGGVMAPPTRQVTADGFELQFGTNYLSHFALTARLLPLLTQGRRARVVNLSSMAHRFGASIHFDDLNGQHRYKAFAAYGQSKLAMLMFTFELQRRSDAHGWGLLSLAAHPGLAATALLQNGQRLGGNDKPGWVETFSSWMPSLLAQSAAEGALHAVCGHITQRRERRLLRPHRVHGIQGRRGRSHGGAARPGPRRGRQAVGALRELDGRALGGRRYGGRTGLRMTDSTKAPLDCRTALLSAIQMAHADRLTVRPGKGGISGTALSATSNNSGHRARNGSGSSGQRISSIPKRRTSSTGSSPSGCSRRRSGTPSRASASCTDPGCTEPKCTEAALGSRRFGGCAGGVKATRRCRSFSCTPRNVKIGRNCFTFASRWSSARSCSYISATTSNGSSASLARNSMARCLTESSS